MSLQEWLAIKLWEELGLDSEETWGNDHKGSWVMDKNDTIEWFNKLLDEWIEREE